MNYKKGAMFGLDARIALAIFGALSVISGAALYSAIQDAKVTAAITEMNEIGKAWEAYYLDTGRSFDPVNTDSTNVSYYIFKTNNLILNSGYDGWSGPYVSYQVSGDHLNHPVHGDISIMRLTTDVDWNHWGSGTCTTGRSCFIWIYINSIDNEDLAKLIDERIDGSDGKSKGSFRWYGPDGSSTYRYALKYVPIENPHD